jgi:hypothetical protein
MSRLVSAAENFICVYSSNIDRVGPEAHIRHRCFTDWLGLHAPSWNVILKIPNPYPEDPNRPDDTSWADFYFFAIDARTAKPVSSEIGRSWPNKKASDSDSDPGRRGAF